MCAIAGVLAPNLREEGHFDPTPIRATWREFLDGQRKWHSHLWWRADFQAWRGLR